MTPQLQVSGYERERYAEEAEEMNERGVTNLKPKYDSDSGDSDSSSDDTPSDDSDADDGAPRERISRQ